MFTGWKTFNRKLRPGAFAGLVGLAVTSAELVDAFGDEAPGVSQHSAPPKEQTYVLGSRTPLIVEAMSNFFGERSMPAQRTLIRLSDRAMPQQQLCDVVSAQINMAKVACANAYRAGGRRMLKTACQLQQERSVAYTQNARSDKDDAATFPAHWNAKYQMCMDAARKYVTQGVESCEQKHIATQGVSDNITGCAGDIP